MPNNEFETSPAKASPSKTRHALPSVYNLLPLAAFGLFATICEKDANAFARLHGPTFPHSEMLEAYGAYWDRDNQAWTFGSEDVLRHFAGALDQAGDTDNRCLAEETQSFIGALDVGDPLGRFLTLGANAFDDQELLSLLLSFDQFIDSPSDTSRSLFREFGSLGAILGSETLRLKGLDDITPRSAALLKAVQVTIERVLHESVQQEKLVIGSSQALLDYLSCRLRHRQREEILILFLDSRNRLIKVDSHEGTINHVPLFPREIATRALELFTKAVIIAHNHPGGLATPSKKDVKTTIQVHEALETLDIDLYDHVIISDESHYSFKTNGII